MTREAWSWKGFKSLDVKYKVVVGVFCVCFFWDIPRQDCPKLETRSAPIPLVSSVHVRGIFLQIPSQIRSDTALPVCSPSSYLWHEIFSMAITLTGFVRSDILFICSPWLDLDSQWYLNQQISLLSFTLPVVSLVGENIWLGFCLNYVSNQMFRITVSNCFNSFMTPANLESVNISIFLLRLWVVKLQLDSKHALHFPCKWLNQRDKIDRCQYKNTRQTW